MILTKQALLQHIEAGTISIDPFDLTQCNPNSYNVRLGKTLLIYDVDAPHPVMRAFERFFPRIFKKLGFKTSVFDLKKENTYRTIQIPEAGLVLYPGTLYLGHTEEVTHTPGHVPIYEGRSSLARAGVESHVCAGWGDVGFEGTWTLEIRVTYPTRIYAGFEIGQVGFCEVSGDIEEYGTEHFKSRYQGQRKPVPYLGHLDFTQG